MENPSEIILQDVKEEENIRKKVGQVRSNTIEGRYYSPYSIDLKNITFSNTILVAYERKMLEEDKLCNIRLGYD